MQSKNSISFIYSITKESLAAQQTQKSVLESKSNTLIGFAGGMVALLIGAKDNIQSMQPPASLFVLISVGLFLASILLGTFVGWVRKYRSDPDPSALAKHYLEKSEQDVQLQLISNLINVWRINSTQLERNAIILRITLFAQALAFIILGIVLIWSLL
jgi:hypothetical protein